MTCLGVYSGFYVFYWWNEAVKGYFWAEKDTGKIFIFVLLYTFVSTSLRKMFFAQHFIYDENICSD